MAYDNKSSKGAQDKILHFLQEEAARLKSDHPEELQKKRTKGKKSDKKRQKLYQKIESVLKISSLNSTIREELLSLQQAIKDSI